MGRAECPRAAAQGGCRWLQRTRMTVSGGPLIEQDSVAEQDRITGNDRDHPATRGIRSPRKGGTRDTDGKPVVRTGAVLTRFRRPFRSLLFDAPSERDTAGCVGIIATLTARAIDDPDSRRQKNSVLVSVKLDGPAGADGHAGVGRPGAYPETKKLLRVAVKGHGPHFRRAVSGTSYPVRGAARGRGRPELRRPAGNSVRHTAGHPSSSMLARAHALQTLACPKRNSGKRESAMGGRAGRASPRALTAIAIPRSTCWGGGDEDWISTFCAAGRARRSTTGTKNRTDGVSAKPMGFRLRLIPSNWRAALAKHAINESDPIDFRGA